MPDEQKMSTGDLDQLRKIQDEHPGLKLAIELCEACLATPYRRLTMPEDQKMVAYIGTKIICAVPMGEFMFAKRKNLSQANPAENRSGYLVAYPDGYESWSPKETFEAAYRPVSDDERKMM